MTPAELISTLPPLRETIQAHGLLAKKSLGQNFLMNPSVTDHIARSAGNLSEGTVIEVGPGPGALTRSILGAGAARLVALEKDERCVAALAELSAKFPDNFSVQSQDALTFDYASLGASPIRIIANLPYNVATPLLIGWLKLISTKTVPIAGMTLMFQKEVADRITAAPGSKKFGRLGIISQWLCDTWKVCDLPPEAFTPAPKVHSSVVGFKPLDKPRFEARMEDLEALTAAAFGQRRKMLRQSLKSLEVPIAELLESAGINGELRGEALTIDDFGRLAQAVERLRKQS
jgi:16S rRNA (adenine1518-N6/adenine1519-N6)-dimethyltransferase